MRLHGLLALRKLCGRVGLQLGLHLQAGIGTGQGAFHRGLGHHGQGGVVATRHGCGDTSVEGGVQRHGGCALQLHGGAVVAIGNVHTVDGQLVVGAVKAVMAGQGGGLQRWRADPAQVVHPEGGIHLDGQQQRLQRFCRGVAGWPQRFNHDRTCVDFAQLHFAAKQGAHLPANIQAFHVHRHARAGPAQPANVAAVAQGSFDVAGGQGLVGGQKPLHLGQAGGQRLVRAGPPPEGPCQHQGQRQQVNHAPDEKAPHARTPGGRWWCGLGRCKRVRRGRELGMGHGLGGRGRLYRGH